MGQGAYRCFPNQSVHQDELGFLKMQVSGPTSQTPKGTGINPGIPGLKQESPPHLTLTYCLV